MKPRTIRIEGDLAYVPLTQGKTAVIDAADVPLVEGRNWFFMAVGYAATWVREKGEKPRQVYMHRVIADTPCELQTDHIDGNGLNNRRMNLRHATKSENMRNKCARADNKSGFKGVSWCKANGKWLASIRLHQKSHNLGYHTTPESAHEAYCQAAKKLHGEFARTA